MKTLFLVILILALAVLAGKLAYTEPGVLAIQYAGWVVETSPVAMLVALTAVVLLLMLSLKLIGLLFGAPGLLKNYALYGRRARAQKRLLRGFAEFTEGNWQSAEKHLLRADEKDSGALVNYLVAARAAHFQGEKERRDALLEKASVQAPSLALAIDITRAELLIDEGDFPVALETLVFLRSKAARNAHIMKLLAGVYHAMGDWSKLDALLPVVRRYRALSGTDLERTEFDCWRGMIADTEQDRLTGYWKRLPKHAQQNVELLILMTDRLLDDGKNATAEKLLREQLNQQWNERLLPIYARVELDDAAQQLDFAERWLGKHGHSAALLATLGQLCLRCQLWGKARVYLESSLGMVASAHASLLLAELLTQLGENDNAREHYANGLRLALNPQQSTAVLSIPENGTTAEGSAVADLKLVESKG